MVVAAGFGGLLGSHTVIGWAILEMRLMVVGPWSLRLGSALQVHADSGATRENAGHLELYRFTNSAGAEVVKSAGRRGQEHR